MQKGSHSLSECADTAKGHIGG
jgi:hypothetical protein